MQDYLHNPQIIFSLIGVAGLLLMIAGLRARVRLRRPLGTLGAIVFHAGLFGFLYLKLALLIFLCLVCLFLSLFAIIDPLKLSHYLPPKIFRSIGLVLLCASVAFGFAYLIDFPTWPWIVPLMIYGLTFLGGPFEKRIRVWRGIALALILAYLGAGGFLISKKFPLGGFRSLFFPVKPVAEENLVAPAATTQLGNTTTSPTSSLLTTTTSENQATEPTEPKKNFTQPDVAQNATTTTTNDQISVSDDDENIDDDDASNWRAFARRLNRLQHDFEDLRSSYDELQRENRELKAEISKKNSN